MEVLKKIDSLVKASLEDNASPALKAEDAPSEHELTPIPDTKEELLRYISDIKPHLRKSVYYLDAYEEAVNKAKRLFPDDSSFHAYTNGAEDFIQRIRAELEDEKQSEKERREDRKFIFVFCLVILNGFFIYWLITLL